MKRSFTNLANLPRRIVRWLRAEERFQVQTFTSGLKNMEVVFGALERLFVHLPGRIGRAAERVLRQVGARLAQAARWPFRAALRGARHLRRGLGRAAQETGSLLKQLGLDCWHVVRGALRMVSVPFAAAGRLTGTVLRKVFAPIAKPFAKSAKQEALGDAPLTPDNKSHLELILLVGGAALIVAGAALAALPGTRGAVTEALPASATLAGLFSPRRLLERLASASPAALAVVGAGVALGTAGVWFWVRMVLDAWRRDYVTHTDRAKWRLYTVLFFIPGAIAYFFRVYNHWTAKRFLSYHFVSVMMTGVAVVVATSTYGTLWYFNKKAEAQVPPANATVPQVELDPQSKATLLNRSRYGAPLSAAGGGRVDPFAPIPGQVPPATPAPSPSPSATPAP